MTQYSYSPERFEPVLSKRWADAEGYTYEDRVQSVGEYRGRDRNRHRWAAA